MTIEKLVYGGWSMGRGPEGQVVFVAGGAPSERVRVVPAGRQAGAEFATLIDIIEPSPYRRVPPCPSVMACGGCDWQYLSYEAQLEAKVQIVAESLRRTGRLHYIPAAEIFASPEWSYRVRTQLKIDPTRRSMGFFRRRSNDVVDIESCLLLCPQLNLLCSRRRDILNAVQSDCRQIKAISGEDVASDPLIEGLTVEKTVVRVGEKYFCVAGGTFFQANRFLLDRLGSWPLRFAKGEILWDLYGGGGFFSAMLGARFSRGIMVESNLLSVETAQRVFSDNGLSHFTPVVDTVESFLAEQSHPPHCCIVDPPRPGLTRAVRQALGRLKPPIIIYISCNPTTLARDIGFFVNQRQYHIEHLAIFDFYPQTHHIEIGAVLMLQS